MKPHEKHALERVLPCTRKKGVVDTKKDGFDPQSVGWDTVLHKQFRPMDIPSGQVQWIQEGGIQKMTEKIRR